ncbi:hypothetical protein BH09MYX1_BH09MYX1_66330 [soil metagenome]
MRFALPLALVSVGSTLLAVVACGGDAKAPVGRPCVDAEADAVMRMRSHFHLSADDTAGFVPKPDKVIDLDHDGQNDRIYTFELNGESLTIVYAMRSACGEPMGEIGGPVTVLPTTSRSFSDLRVTVGSSWKICRLGDDGYKCTEP